MTASVRYNSRFADEKKDRGAFDDRTARSEQLLSMAQQILEANPARSHRR